MMKQVVKEGTGTAAALEGVERGRQDRHGRDRHRAAASTSRGSSASPTDVAVAVVLERVQGGTGGIVAAPIAKQVLEALGQMSDARHRARHGDRRALPGAQPARLGRHGRRLLRRGPAARPPRGAEAAVPALRRGRRSSSSASAARRRARPACSTRTSSAIFDRGEWDGTYYIAMEFLEGRTLKQLVRERGPLDARPRRSTSSMQILRAARFAHQRGIVHRDIKPHNVIVDDEGRAKVTDFGIARAGASDMTETGSIMGTAQYLSPEQAQGQPGRRAAPTSTRSAIVLYELLTGRVPFDAESPVTIALKQVSEEPVPPRSCNPAVPPALEAVVLRALEKDPARRFPTPTSSSPRSRHARGRPATGTYARSCRRAPGRRSGRGRSRRPTGATGAGWLWLLLAARAGRRSRVGAYLLLAARRRSTVPDVVGQRRRRPPRRSSRTAGFEVQHRDRAVRRRADATA